MALLYQKGLAGPTESCTDICAFTLLQQNDPNKKEADNNMYYGEESIHSALFTAY